MAESRKKPPADEVRSANGNAEISRIGLFVIAASFMAIFLMVTAMTLIGVQTGPGQVLERTFNILLPVLATWVGTVLTFYFNERARQGLQDTLGEALTRNSNKPPPEMIPVAQKMVVTSDIISLIELKDIDEKNITVGQMRMIFKGVEYFEPKSIFFTGNNNNNGLTQNADRKVTRLIFTYERKFKYIIHSSTLDEFIAKKFLDAGQEKTANDVNSVTLSEVLGEKDVRSQIEKMVVFAPISESLGAVQQRMNQNIGAQDAFITVSGGAAEPILGWLSDVDLLKHLKAN